MTEQNMTVVLYRRRGKKENVRYMRKGILHFRIISSSQVNLGYSLCNEKKGNQDHFNFEVGLSIAMGRSEINRLLQQFPLNHPISKQTLLKAGIPHTIVEALYAIATAPSAEAHSLIDVDLVGKNSIYTVGVEAVTFNRSNRKSEKLCLIEDCDELAQSMASFNADNLDQRMQHGHYKTIANLLKNIFGDRRILSVYNRPNSQPVKKEKTFVINSTSNSQIRNAVEFLERKSRVQTNSHLNGQHSVSEAESSEQNIKTTS